MNDKFFVSNVGTRQCFLYFFRCLFLEQIILDVNGFS